MAAVVGRHTSLQPSLLGYRQEVMLTVPAKGDAYRTLVTLFFQHDPTQTQADASG